MVVFFAAGAMEWGSGDDLENSGQGLGGKPGWRDVVLVTLNKTAGHVETSHIGILASSLGNFRK